MLKYALQIIIRIWAAYWFSYRMVMKTQKNIFSNHNEALI